MVKAFGWLIFFLLTLEVDIWTAENNDTFSEVETFEKALQLVDKVYVDSCDTKVLLEESLQGLFSSLDPYSEYMNQIEYENFLKSQKGVFVGVGLELVTKNQFHVVVTTLFDSPAELAGIKAGDRLIRVNGTSVMGKSLDSTVNMVQGVPGTPVRLTFLRFGQEIEFVLYRGSIKSSDIRDECVIEESIGYFKITRFRKGTAQDVRNVLDHFLSLNISGLVIDLRNNPGGLLEEAVNVASLFLRENKVVVRVQGKDKFSEKKYRTFDPPIAEKIPMCILINKGTASAAEVLGGAFRDYKRATIVGQRSFGKGSIQILIPLLKNEGAIKITSHRYVLPKGDRIEGQGLMPEIVVGLPKGQDIFRIDLRRKKMAKTGSVKFAMKTLKDKQLTVAIEDLLP
ncbi:hypothetical protein AB834_03040 [PVC group bacterium (ex Bugula neritina AB1)]|nr:hypothetical protein AB834_03040 [PVC group bacterium (ex Bugula neritina AB1)]